jgi:hypothetical protein
VPNAPGDVALLITPLSVLPVTTQDTGGGVTVGSIIYGNSNDMGGIDWRITMANGIALNPDGGGFRFATISNDEPRGIDVRSSSVMSYKQKAGH